MEEEIKKYIDIKAIISLTNHLAEVLAKETKLLTEMRISELETLQKEKNCLIDAMESQKQFINKNPDMLRYIDDEECLELAQAIESFQRIAKENYRRALIAKEVNKKVVEAIAEAANEAARISIYDKNGQHGSSEHRLCVSYSKSV